MKIPRLANYERTIARMTLNRQLATENAELASFFHHSVVVGAESGITEFAARVCYNSTPKIGTAPNFVTKVLQSGHLSVAEHSVVAIHGGELNLNYQKDRGTARYYFLRRNRYFDFAENFVIGNLRSWVECVAYLKDSDGLRVLITIFPGGFVTTPDIGMHIIEIETFSNFINVPSYYSNGMAVHMLAANVDVPYRKRREEENVIEYGRFTWLIEGVSRSLTHQLVRHRGASISQESQRYVDAMKRPAFVYPRDITDSQRSILEEQNLSALATYEALRKSGMKKEDARFVLPNGIATRLVVSFSMRDLLHFLKVRCAKDAQWEIREMAFAMLNQVVLCKPTTEIMELKQWTELQKQN